MPQTILSVKLLVNEFGNCQGTEDVIEANSSQIIISHLREIHFSLIYIFHN